MKPEFATALKIVLASASSFGKLPSALSEFFANFSAPFDIFKRKEAYTDMRAGEEEVCNAAGLSFWVGSAFGIIAFFLAVLNNIFLKFSIGGIVSSIFSLLCNVAIPLILATAFVYFATKYSGAWSTLLAKIFTVLVIINLVVSGLTLVFGVIGLIGSVITVMLSFTLGLLGIFSTLVGMLNAAINIAICAMALNGVKRSVGYNS